MAPVAGYFSGKWTCSGTFSNGKPIASTIRFESNVNGAAVVVHHDDVPALGSYHSIEVWGFQQSTGTYVATLYDAYSGARGFTSAGWSGDVLTPGRPDASRQARLGNSSTRERRPNTFTVEWKVYRNEAYVVGDTLTCKRDATS